MRGVATSHDCCCGSVNPVPRPYPDESSCSHYLAVNDTPNTGRNIDDYHPRVQMKKIFAGNKQYFDDPNNIKQFSKKYIVPEDAVRKYVDHMKLLELNGKRGRKRQPKKMKLNPRRITMTMTGKKCFMMAALES